MKQTKEEDDEVLIEEMIKDYEDSLKVSDEELDYESLGVKVSNDFINKIMKKKGITTH